MNQEVISSYIPLYIEAFFLTVKIGWLGIVLSLMIGVMTAFVMYFKVPVLSQISKVYVELFRNTPLLVQLFFIYFGLPKIGISVPAETCGFIGLGLLGGSYMTEVFRSGLEGVPVSQTEGSMALGLTKKQMFIYVMFARAVADRMIFLEGGNIVEEGTAKEFFERPKTERLKKFLETFSYEK